MTFTTVVILSEAKDLFADETPRFAQGDTHETLRFANGDTRSQC